MHSAPPVATIRGLVTAEYTAPVSSDKKPKTKRFALDLTLEQHRILKGAAVDAGLTMRILVLRLLHREGLLGEALLDPDPAPSSNEGASQS